MIIGILSVSKKNGLLRIEAPIAFQNTTRNCFFELPVEYESLTDTEHADAFLLALLLPAMIAGESITVKSPVSERLARNLTEEIIPILNAFNPAYQKIEVLCEQLSHTVFPGERGIGTGFSGGVDSILTAMDHGNKNVSENYKLTHFFFFNVGAHGMGHSEEALAKIQHKFEIRYKTLKQFADELSLPFIPVNSNVHSFHTVGHLEGCSIVTPAVALLFQKGLRRYFLSSGGHNHKEKLEDLVIRKEKSDTAVLDPLILPYFSTENIDILPVGSRYTRFEKTVRIAEYEPARRFLNVCANYNAMEENCSVCEKCCITIMTLEILGKAEAFRKVFNFDVYHKFAEKRFVAKVLALRNEEPYFKELCSQAEKAKYSLTERTTLKDRIMFRFEDSPLHNALRRIPGLRAFVRAFRNR